MTNQELVAFYRKAIYDSWDPFVEDAEMESVSPESVYQAGGNDSGVCISPYSTSEHLLFMLDEMDKMLTDTRLERLGDQQLLAKFNRWMGFVQGCLWTNNCFTLNELRDHVRPCSKCGDSGRVIVKQGWTGYEYGPCDCKKEKS